ncbi:MAG: dipeptidase [candidate division Zixibacteria bacterium]|nr:dipeptidase [candidate division Zixibacteria bacterium]
MSADYRILHERAFVADLHCDTILWMQNGRDISVRNADGHVDIPRLAEGGVNLQVFACFVAPQTPTELCAATIDRRLDVLTSEFAHNSDAIAACTNAAGAEEIVADGRIAAVIGIENGEAIAGSLNNLAHFHGRGVRYMTLTHGVSHDWCISSGDKQPAFRGLTDFGRKVVRRMNELGMIVDVSHISVEAVEEVLEVSRDPVIASHSCAHALCPHNRNLTDDQIKAIADGGGMIGINFCRDFLSAENAAVTEKHFRDHIPELEALDKLTHDEHDKAEFERGREALKPFLKTWAGYYKGVCPSLTDVVDHILHIANVAGADHVGLGSDYDGIFFPPEGLEDCSKMPNVTRELLSRGCPEEDIVKILGGNFMRVFRKVCDR